MYVRAVQVESGTFRDKKMRHTNPFESNKIHVFGDVWSILLDIHEEKMIKFHFKPSCVTLVQNYSFTFPLNIRDQKLG